MTFAPHGRPRAGPEGFGALAGEPPVVHRVQSSLRPGRACDCPAYQVFRWLARIGRGAEGHSGTCPAVGRMTVPSVTGTARPGHTVTARRARYPEPGHLKATSHGHQRARAGLAPSVLAIVTTGARHNRAPSGSEHEVACRRGREHWDAWRCPIARRSGSGKHSRLSGTDKGVNRERRLRLRADFVDGHARSEFDEVETVDPDVDHRKVCDDALHHAKPCVRK